MVNGLLEEVLAILEEKKEMSSAADSATLLSLVATFANDPESKASKKDIKYQKYYEIMHYVYTSSQDRIERDL